MNNDYYNTVSKPMREILDNHTAYKALSLSEKAEYIKTTMRLSHGKGKRKKKGKR